MKYTCIYQLEDPCKPNFPVYIGKGLQTRAESHWKIFLRNGRVVNVRLRRKFESFRAVGTAPVARVIDYLVPVDGWEEFEKLYIAGVRKRNPDLCNVLSGGNALPAEIGRIGGKSAWKNNREKMLEATRRGGKSAWKNNRKKMLITARQGRKIASSTGGKSAWKNNREKMLEAARQSGKIGAHRRWHAAREIIDSSCKFCTESGSVTEKLRASQTNTGLMETCDGKVR